MEKSTKKERSEAAAKLGRVGGPALVKKMGKGFMSKIGKKGAKKRWSQ